MLSGKELSKYLDKRFKIIQKYIAEFKSSEDIHDLRVEIKKARAVIKLIEFSNRDKMQWLSLKPLKVIFKHAGTIREADVNLKLLKKYNIQNNQFVNEQKTLMENNFKTFGNFAEKYIKDIKTLKEFMAIVSHNIKNDTIVDYIKHVLVLMKFKLNDLHSCRKLLKEIVYIYDVIDNSLRYKLKLDIDKIDNMQNNIGEWHNLEVAVNIFKFKLINEIALISKLNKEKNSMESHIKDDLKNYLSKVLSLA